MKILLEGVDPRFFNSLASIVAEILQIITAFVLSEFFRWLLCHYLKGGHAIPVRAMGRLPAGFLDSLEVAQAMRWAPPALFMTALFLSDYATTVAFVGMDFETTQQIGAMDSILNLQLRNPQIPYEALGDPALPQTRSKLERILQESGGQLLFTNEENENEEAVRKMAQEETTVSSFLLAADAMARGESPFLGKSDFLQTDANFLFVGQSTLSSDMKWNQSTVLFAPTPQENTNDQESSYFLSGVPLAIPLDCQQWDMLEIQEERGLYSDFQTTSLVPPCDFVALRASGMYHRVRQATVTSYASTSNTALFLGEQQDEPLRQGFFFPMNGMPLARDRVGDFRQGRTVLGFDSLLYEDQRIPLEQAVIAAGVLQSTQSYEAEGAEVKHRRDYMLVGKIQPENCPKDPSGAAGSECMAIMALECENFGPDSGTSWLQPTTCSLIQTELVWGKNWNVDEHLLAAVTGVYGRNAAWAAASLRQRRTLAIHALPAAMFTMGSLDVAPSIEEVKSTSIDSIFLIFMAFPVFLCLATGAIYMLNRKSILPIPDDGYKMLALCQQQEASEQSESEVDDMYVAFHANKVVLSGMKPDDLVFHEEKKCDGEAIEEPPPTEKAPATETPEVEEDAIASAMEKATDVSRARHFRRSLERSDKATLRRSPPSKNELTRTASIWVISCICVSILILLIGGIWVGAKRANEDYEPKLYPLATTDFGSEENSDFNTVPPGCFSSRAELHRAISVYFDGTADSQQQTQAQFGDLRDWCVDYIDDFSFLFVDRDLQNENLSSWNVSKSRSFSYCFYGSSFDGDLGTWSVGNSRDFSGMFNLAYDFQGLGLSTWDVSQATNMAYMFYDAPSFVGNISQWQTGLVRDFSGTFSTGGIFATDLSAWNVSSTRSMLDMFYEAYWFNSDLSNWDTSNVETFRYMFEDAVAFNGNISTWDVSNAHDFSYMFLNAESFEGDLSGWQPSNAVYMRSMFENSAFGGDLSGWNTGKVVTFAEMFKNVGGEFQGLSNWNVASGVYFFQMFHGSSFNEDISTWSVGNARELTFMFRSADNFTQNLCPWVSRLQESALTIDMFIYSGCQETHETSELAMCHWCVEEPPTPEASTPAPTVFCEESNRFVLELKTDDFPEETSWDIVDSDGTEVAYGNEYDYNEDAFFVIQECLESGKNYTWTIHDSWGDGLCCVDDYASGWYSVTVGGEVLVTKGGKFGESSSIEFSVA